MSVLGKSATRPKQCRSWRLATWWLAPRPARTRAVSYRGVAALGIALAGLACGSSESSEAPTPADPPASGSLDGAGGNPAQVLPNSGSGGAGEVAAGEQQNTTLPIAPGAGGAGAQPTAGSLGGAGAAGAGAEPGDPDVTPPTADLSAVTIWIAGDSTVANGNTPCPRGWGGELSPHFIEDVTVNNSAAGGRSVHTWLYDVQDVLDSTGECALALDASGEPVLQPRWQAMLDGMRAGDYLFIQFGINDGDPSCDRHVGLDAFKAAYAMMASAARERGAQPIFLTPVSSIACAGASARGSRGAFVPATLETGLELDVPVIDLHARSVALFQSLAFCPVSGGDVSAETSGPVGDFFCDDHTHFSSVGARAIAELVVQALREQQSPLVSHLR
jgi:lysophospholipase L1-like esterase